MPRYVALIRGINVGGKTMVKMDELKALFTELGFENVTSYINSGNIGFDSQRSSEKGLMKDIEAAVEKQFARHFDVILRNQTSIRQIIDADPFAGEYDSHKLMHVLFLKVELPIEKHFLLSEIDFGDEKFICLGREIYLLLPSGVADSVFSRKGVLDKPPRVPYTARNWRTVQKLATL
jgi:uncharacterized protein (DUF1697 family)